MASEIKFNCGCGFSTSKLEEATNHSNSNKHILTILGLVKPEPTKEV